MSDKFTQESELLKISEMSKLRNIPITTLKYYDRIGLLKPALINEENNYKYYSVAQYDIIGLIIELRQLDVPLVQIKKYIECRNIATSLEVLKDQDKKIDEILKELTNLSSRIKEKISLVQEVSSSGYNLKAIREKVIPERKIFTFNRNVKTDIEGSYAALELEQLLKEKAPTLASVRLGALIPQKDIEENILDKHFITFIFSEEPILDDKITLIKIPSSTFITAQYNGTLWERSETLQRLLDHIKEKGYKIAGDALQLNIVSEVITKFQEEFVFEIQIPVSI